MIKEKLNRLRTMPVWQRNIIVLWFGTFMAGVGFSEVLPFLSFYIDELGNFTKSQLNFYSGVTFAITFLVTAVVSPFWGKLADIKGRKLMLLRASFGMAIVFSLMGLSQNVWQLIGLRALQGVFAGFVSNANALIATETPKHSSGKALGILVTGTTSGSLLGPLLGGALANIFDYRNVFFVTGGLLFLVFLLSFFFVKETKQAPAKGLMQAQSFHSVYHMLKSPQLIIGLVITTMIIQASNNSINPILSLYVRQMMSGHGNVTFTAGIVAAMPGIATVIAAPIFGRVGDRVGTERMLMAGFLWAVLVFALTGFVHSIPQLMLLRFFVGISDATMLPAVNTLLAKNTPTAVTGRIFSYNQSFQSIGSVIGPMLGTTVSSMFGYSAVFFSTAILVLMNMILFYFNSKELRLERKMEKEH